MKRIAVVTSSGDAPGMNAAIRAVACTGLDKRWDIFGVRYGYVGLNTDAIVPLGARDVGDIIQQSGTILGSSRCLEFETEDGRLKALETLGEHGIDALSSLEATGLRLELMRCPRWVTR